jgi:DNA-directed RNA polymerase sigma subunit (sigma70/sigma32)
MNDRKEMEPFEKLKKILTSVDNKKETLINESIVNKKGKSLGEVGRDYKTTRERIREIERKALRKLNRKQPEPPDEAA